MEHSGNSERKLLLSSLYGTELIHLVTCVEQSCFTLRNTNHIYSLLSQHFYNSILFSYVYCSWVCHC